MNVPRYFFGNVCVRVFFHLTFSGRKNEVNNQLKGGPKMLTSHFDIFLSFKTMLLSSHVHAVNHLLNMQC